MPVGIIFIVESVHQHMKWIVIAPHPDDEVIGCHTMLSARDVIEVWYVWWDTDRQKEALKCSDLFLFRPVFLSGVEGLLERLKTIDVSIVGLVLPSPGDDHYQHKQAYYIVSACLPMVRIRVYSTGMKEWFVRKASDSTGKRCALDCCYPSQASLWKYDYRYFMFEGMVELT